MRNLKKLSLIMLYGSILISSCHNAGDDGDNTRSGNNSHLNASMSTNSKTVAPTTTPESTFNFKNYAASGIADSFFSGGFLAIPGTLFVGWITDLIIGGESEPTAQILDKLDKIQDTLDKMTLQLKTSLAFSDSTLRKLDIFMKDYKTDQFDSLFQEIHQHLTVTKSKYDMFNTQQVFEKNLTAKDQAKLYALAYKSCNNKGILSVIDANLSSSNLSTDNLFSEFKQAFISNNSKAIGGIWGQFQKRRTKYLDASFSTVYTNEDKMDYINYYNYQAAVYAASIYASYQELYNMQLAQLTYNYACNTNISLDNLKVDDSKSGFDGYTHAVNELNKVYNTNFDLLTTNISKYMKPVDNAELTELINNKLFSKARVKMLEARNFGVNLQNKQECSISNLTIKLQDGSPFGMANLVARCVVDKQQNGIKLKLRTAFAHQSIPFIRTTDTITKVGVHDIYTRSQDVFYDPKTEYADISFSVNGSQFDENDISNLIGEGKHDISDMEHFDHMQEFTYPTFEKENWGKTGYSKAEHVTYAWKAATLSVNNDTYLFPKRGIQHYGYKDHPYTNYDGNVFPDPYSDVFSFKSGYDGDIIQSSKAKIFDGLGSGNHQFAHWYMATTHGMVYTIKIHSLHYGANEGDLRQKNYYSNGNVIGQVVGLGCLYNIDNICTGATNGVLLDSSDFGKTGKFNSITLTGKINPVGEKFSGGNSAFSIDAKNQWQLTESAEITLPIIPINNGKMYYYNAGNWDNITAYLASYDDALKSNIYPRVQYKNKLYIACRGTGIGYAPGYREQDVWKEYVEHTNVCN